MDFIGTYLSFCWLFSGCFCNFLFSFLPFFFLSFLVIWWLYLVLGLDSFFFCLCIYYRFWVCDFPRSCISLVAFQIPSLSFIFFILITMCLSMDLFRLIRYRTLCSSWTWMIVSFPQWEKFSATQFSSVAQLCPTLWDPIDGSMPGFPILHCFLVLHHVLEFSVTHRDLVYLVSGRKRDLYQEINKYLWSEQILGNMYILNRIIFQQSSSVAYQRHVGKW